MNARQSPYEAFMARMAAMYWRSSQSGSMAVYEALKAEFVARVPDATPSQYQQAMQAAAKAAGV